MPLVYPGSGGWGVPVGLWNGGLQSGGLQVGAFKVAAFKWRPSSGSLQAGAFKWGPSSGGLQMGAFKWGPSSWGLQVGVFKWGSSSGGFHVGAFKWGPSKWGAPGGTLIWESPWENPAAISGVIYIWKLCYIGDNSRKMHPKMQEMLSRVFLMSKSLQGTIPLEEGGMLFPNGSSQNPTSPSLPHRWRSLTWSLLFLGKPSAGKSTFFNASTHQNLAKVAAHPFTTIEPNIGKAFYAIPCPCANMDTTCQAMFGHAADGDRYVPILLKDVAGLVPGACDGRGRGNRFLNDLLDADVLIHVVDVSGETDENGKQTQGVEDLAPKLGLSWHDYLSFMVGAVTECWTGHSHQLLSRHPQLRGW